MPGFIVADAVSCRAGRLTFVVPSHSTGRQETEAFRVDEGVKPSRIPG